MAGAERKMTRRIRNVVGNVPEPGELYGRSEFLRHLWRQIRGNNLMLLAPRRFGKTGIMRHVLEKPEEGYLPVLLDLEDVDSAREFVWRVTREVLARDRLRAVVRAARRLPRVFDGWVKDTFDEVGFEGAKVKFKKAIEEDWATAARQLLVELEKADETIVFIFDELPAMLDTIRRRQSADEARQFMAWFRAARLQQKDQLRRHRFLIGGSTGIDITLRRLDAPDKLNDFERLYVEPIHRDAAAELVRDLAASMDVGLSDPLVERILERMSPHVPYFIHLLFSQLGQLPRLQRDPLTTERLEDVYARRVLGPTCKHYFDHYRTRLGRYGKRLGLSANALLTAVAESSTGRVGASALYDVYRSARGHAASEREFDELLADLECDWYLTLDPRTNEYFFMVGVMRDWWRRWFGSARRRRVSAE
jgi:hypothetical protein